MKKLLLILSVLFPLISFGQANLSYVRSIDSTFAIVNQAYPDDTLFKFLKNGNLVRYASNTPIDTFALKSDTIRVALYSMSSGTLDSNFVTITVDTVKINIESSIYESSNDLFISTENGVHQIIMGDQYAGGIYLKTDSRVTSNANNAGDYASVIVDATGDEPEINMIVEESAYSMILDLSDSLLFFRIEGDSIFRFGDNFIKVFRNFYAGYAELDSFRVGNGDVISSTDTVDLKTAVEQEDFDSLNMNGYFIRFNESEGIYEFETAKAGVVWQGALEDLVQFYNNSGVTIPNGYPVAFSGTVTGDSIPNGRLATNLSEDLSDAFVAISTIEVPDGEWGYATTRGFVRGVPADFDSVELWLGNYELIDSVPDYPSRKVFAGIVIKSDPTDGIIYANPSQAYRRSTIGKSYNFTTQGIGAGTYYRAGFYRAPATNANLTQASTTQTYGTANVAYSAHPFIVCGGAGSVDAGVVGLRVTGTSIDDLGNYTASDADTILTDITSVSTDEYYEAKKFLGTVTYELITMSGSPTTYSLDFNYGYAKYEDFGNRDAWVTGIEVVGLAAASDVSFNVELMYHTNTGWTYNATAFVPGNGVLASWDTDLGTKDDLSNGLPFAWKRTNVNTFIEGSGSEGIIVRITTGANNSVQSMDINLSIALESE